ncbi:MAG: helix-turn-helix transcriptional regulator [Myxococcales bacterium]|nr:helix-turn-helix transcriptional regulator [Myxococcales bacterium]MCB9717830.1 helix-turn-helix transcriptional regulator [Myxococcales bacterium]
MTEIAQLFESALRQNQAKAAMGTVARMPAETTLRELLESDAGEAVRALSLRDLAQALRDAGLQPRGSVRAAVPAPVVGRKRMVAPAPEPERKESREAQLYRRILEAMADEPLTIGQLAKRLGLETSELRDYLVWMKNEGKIVSTGRARATRYQLAPS